MLEGAITFGLRFAPPFAKNAKDGAPQHRSTPEPPASNRGASGFTRPSSSTVLTGKRRWRWFPEESPPPALPERRHSVPTESAAKAEMLMEAAPSKSRRG